MLASGAAHIITVVRLVFMTQGCNFDLCSFFGIDGVIPRHVEVHHDFISIFYLTVLSFVFSLN